MEDQVSMEAMRYREVVGSWVCLEGKADVLMHWTWRMAPSGGLKGGSQISGLTSYKDGAPICC